MNGEPTRNDLDHDESDRDGSTTAWIVAVVAIVAVVLLIAYARRDPGYDDRVPDPPAGTSTESTDV